MFIFKLESVLYFLQKRVIKLLVMLFTFLQILFMHQASAYITGAHGVQYQSGQGVICDDTIIGLQNGAVIRSDICTLQIDANNYVPASGTYKVRLYVVNHSSGQQWTADSKAVYFDQNKPMLDQNLDIGGGQGDVAFGISTYEVVVTSCYALVDERGEAYTINMPNSDSVNCGSAPPLPPTPPKPDIACVINNGNVLDVDLGTLDRAQLPTVPTEGKTIPVSVNCTGGAVTVNMQLNYTPITVGATEIAKSDANGLGVAIMYNSKTLSTTDITPLTFLEGGDTFDLAFQAVRDPNVAEGDVPVGQFKASATLVLTQQ